MRTPTDPDKAAAGQEALNPSGSEGETALAKQVLLKLQHDVTEAERRIEGCYSSLLVEANEQLVFAMLRAHAEAEATAKTLEEVARAAEIDPLTGLPNRVRLKDRFRHDLASARRRGERLAVMYLDLNKFKDINDTLGHSAGDEVLKRAAACISDAVRATDTVCRHGGDEFIILLPDVGNGTDIAKIGEKIVRALGVPRRMGDHVLRLTVSIGISIFPDDADDPDHLIDFADAAMYRAKKLGMTDILFHGQVLDENQRGTSAPAFGSFRRPLTHFKLGLDQKQRRYSQRRNEDERMLRALPSAQQLQAAAERALRRQTEFLAMLAHEQRNALAPIRNASALLGRLHTDEPLLPRMQAIIERQVAHISRLVDDVLDLSRVSTGKLRLMLQPVDMIALLEQAVDACRPAVDARMQRFNVEIPAACIEVTGDPVRLAQVLSNLLDNASKYTPEGGEISLCVTCGDVMVDISITDSGIGIAPDVMPSIFDLFVQDIHAPGFHGDGLGIGLTVVRKLVESHGGTVVASSEGSGKGSTFVVTLPLAPFILVEKECSND